MSTGQPVFVRLFRLWASVIRLLGGFPFSWNKSESGAMFPGLMRRRYLQVWSIVVLLAYALCIVTVGFFYEAPQNSRIISGTKNAVAGIMKAVDSMSVSSTVLYLWLGQNHLASLLSHLDKCLPSHTMRSWTLSRDKGFILITLCHSAIYITFTYISILSFEVTFSEVGEIMFCATRLIYGYLSLINVSTHTLSIYLTSCFLEGTVNDVQEMLITEAKAYNTTDKEPGVGRECFVVKNNNRSNEEEATQVRRACEHICKIHECQLQMAQYFSFPVLALMTYSVAFCIAVLYSVVTEMKYDFLHCLYVTYSIIITAIFCCTAEKVFGKVSTNCLLK